MSCRKFNSESFPTIYLHELSLIAHITAKLYLFPDNSISVLAKHNSFRRQKQEMYLLPIIVTDDGEPPMSSTNTLTIRVCGCSRDGFVQSCNVEAFVLPIGLSMGALIAILACVILLLGRSFLSCLFSPYYFFYLKSTLWFACKIWIKKSLGKRMKNQTFELHKAKVELTK